MTLDQIILNITNAVKAGNDDIAIDNPSPELLNAIDFLSAKNINQGMLIKNDAGKIFMIVSAESHELKNELYDCKKLVLKIDFEIRTEEQVKNLYALAERNKRELEERINNETI